ncbi:Hypothetical protein Minf_1755 [Methylacidiphilum infernorum V4]|uniref:Uncharacterized protein n=1 Tax=Methylacidiphilum infernorum (isolate V4) TaxID=481448 RepID=B3DXA0_METI4|nr:Hypothetical protein Minf_1755 [Methylacidiphilum infernorum V4]
MIGWKNFFYKTVSVLFWIFPTLFFIFSDLRSLIFFLFLFYLNSFVGNPCKRSKDRSSLLNFFSFQLNP